MKTTLLFLSLAVSFAVGSTICKDNEDACVKHKDCNWLVGLAHCSNTCNDCDGTKVNKKLVAILKKRSRCKDNKGEQCQNRRCAGLIALIHCPQTCNDCDGTKIKRAVAILKEKSRCKDNMKDCAKYNCTGVYLTLCSKTCNDCDAAKGRKWLAIVYNKTRCEDADPTEQCEEKADRENGCSEDMKKYHCRKTCNTCDYEGAETSDDEATQTYRNIVFDKSICEDAEPTEQCKEWRDDPRGCNENLRKWYCRKTCNACEGGSAGGSNEGSDE